MQRPVISDLDGLIQFIARPNSRFAAAWVARSVLIGLDDAQLQTFIDGSERGEDLLTRLSEHTVNERQRALLERWSELSRSGRLIDLLEETIDRSDILTAYPDPVSRQDVEQIVEVIRSMSIEVGGAPIEVGGEVRLVGERSANNANTITMNRYTLVDAYLALGLGPARLTFFIENLTDTAYASWSDVFYLGQTDPGFIYSNQVMLGAPRTFSLLLQTRF